MITFGIVHLINRLARQNKSEDIARKKNLIWLLPCFQNDVPNTRVGKRNTCFTIQTNPIFVSEIQ